METKEILRRELALKTVTTSPKKVVMKVVTKSGYKVVTHNLALVSPLSLQKNI